MLEEIIDNWNSYCKDENFVGIGSTRKVYKVSNYVIKVHLHSNGYKQSQNELQVFSAMEKKGLASILAKTYYVDDFISIQDYYLPLELIDNQSYDINPEIHSHLIPDRFETVMNELDKNFDCFDLKDSSNFGLNNNGKLVLTDYGMTKELYEKEWVPLAEEGLLPQIYFESCNTCGEKKELRIYGDNDIDKRCYDCGKE
ncbi:protein kinase [Sporosarcina siberiensis]|uniref:Protein kinase n=1 Tax=Sporosarcina siberiensis TaxID=1365606 RepID=A0ABW4SHI5_9BACL